MISKEQGLIFVHIPKTAGTALSMSVFAPPSGDPHIGIPDLRVFHKDVEWDSFTKFCFLRDPFDRFASTYKQLTSKKRIPEINHRLSHEHFRDFVLNYWAPMVKGESVGDVSDLGLVTWLRENVIDAKYSAFNPNVYQSYLKESDGSLGVDYVLDFSRPRSQLELIDKKIKAQGKSGITDRILFLREENPIRFNDFWDRETREVFREICKSDIEFYDELKKNAFSK